MTFQARPRSSSAVRLLGALAVAGFALLGWWQRQQTVAAPSASGTSSPRTASDAWRDTTATATDDRLSVARAWERHAHDAPVADRGTVAKILPDDREGSRHQRFLVRVDGGPTILIAHNLDLATRVEPLRPGDAIAFRGEYVWNPKGGIVHWTHHDPDGRHAPGWIEVGGHRFD
jgi:hypothetical protein